ncbi:MAG: hypothetical protein JKX73_01860, partial [Flavobacteriales bacterium]|nr:hypothetical protein [Flavobacteriales bacterium]
MVGLRNIILSVFLLVGQVVHGQGQGFDIAVSMEVPMPNELNWDEIWNVTIESKIAGATMPTTVDLSVQMNLKGIIYEATTDKFIVPLGTTYLNSSIAKTKNASVQIEDPVHTAFYREYNSMVDGTYQMCVTLNLYNPLGDILYTTTDCIFHDVSHAGIIILNTPINGDTVESELLQFNWTHVTERVPLLDPYYVLDLVDVIDGQTPTTAIAMNPKRITAEQIEEPYLDYPQIERPLDTGKVYAWRVIAYTATKSTTRNKTGQSVFNGNIGSIQEIARSEVGYFVCGSKRGPKTPTRIAKTEYYINLQAGADNQTYYFSNALPLSLTNRHARRSID